MSIASSLAIVTLAALIHASFQLSISVLTLLSGHAIGAKHSTTRVLKLTSSFVFGTGLMTVFVLAFVSLVVLALFGTNPDALVWAIGCGFIIGVGIAVWMFYYRREKGTGLWIPRSIARFLSDRTKDTKSSAEAFGLGMVSVLGELLFIIAPVFLSALVIVHLPGAWQLLAIAIYAVVSLFTLFSVWGLIGSGHKLSDIQKWRETNKYFLQFAAGSGLIILAMFTYVAKIVADAAGSAL